jgi:hypothetical protein
MIANADSILPVYSAEHMRAKAYTRKRDSDGLIKSIWHDFGTLEGRIGLMEQQPRLQVPYNQYALHVGA